MTPVPGIYCRQAAPLPVGAVRVAVHPGTRADGLGRRGDVVSTGGGDSLDGPDQIVAPPATEAVSPEAVRLVGVGNGGATEQHRGTGECGAQMGDDPASRGG
jgi:hypothetical protein